jgi:hypothetical protein
VGGRREVMVPSEAVSPSWYSIGNSAASLDSSAASENRLDLVDFKQSRVGQRVPPVQERHRGPSDTSRRALAAAQERPALLNDFALASTVVEQRLMNPKLLIEIEVTALR